jgi:ketosteroid isomerase-like protein
MAGIARSAVWRKPTQRSDGLEPTRDTAVVSEADARPDPAGAVREHLDRIERGDVYEAIADYAEDAVLEAIEMAEAGAVLTGTYPGREAIGRWLDNWFSSFEPGSYRFDVEESIENGERVFMTIHHTARGEASGVEVAARNHHVFTVREGLIVRHAFSTEREAMLRAAGIESR